MIAQGTTLQPVHRPTLVVKPTEPTDIPVPGLGTVTRLTGEVLRRTDVSNGYTKQDTQCVDASVTPRYSVQQAKRPFRVEPLESR